MSKYWTTKDGKRLRISDMSTRHIKNCLAMLMKRHGKTDMLWGANDIWGVDAEVGELDFMEEIEMFKEELRKRENEN